MSEEQRHLCSHAHSTLAELITRIRENIEGERSGGREQMIADLDEAQRCYDECAAGCRCGHDSPGSWAYLSAGLRLRKVREKIGDAIHYLKGPKDEGTDSDTWRMKVSYILDQAMRDSPTLSERRAELLMELESAVSLCSWNDLQKLGEKGARIRAAIIQCIQDYYHALEVRNRFTGSLVDKPHPAGHFDKTIQEFLRDKHS